MPSLDSYKDKYRFIRFERTEGVLVLTIHFNGGPAQWGSYRGALHDELGQAFYDLGRDTENRVLIITGTGDTFLTEHDWSVSDPDFGTFRFWERIMKEGKDLLMNLLEIEVPIIGAVNGPAFIHAEIPTMSDIVLASENASFADKAHAPAGVVPGDGVHVWWLMLLGLNRGRHFLLTGHEIGAHEAKALGVVAEVLPQDQLLARAHEIARHLASQPTAMLRGSRAAFVQHVKRRMLDDLALGLLYEGMGVLEMVQGLEKEQ